MAKEFKEFEKKYSRAEIRQYIDANTVYFGVSASLIKLTAGLDSWKYPVNKWSHVEVRHAVYFEHNAEDWQQFRLALKLLDTKQKLYALEQRLRRSRLLTLDEAAQEQCRIDNYLGALVRGGLLTTDYKFKR